MAEKLQFPLQWFMLPDLNAKLPRIKRNLNKYLQNLKYKLPSFIIEKDQLQLPQWLFSNSN